MLIRFVKTSNDYEFKLLNMEFHKSESTEAIIFSE